jgi:CheY-like chemotaxis protein
VSERGVILIVEDNEIDLLRLRRAFAKAKVLNPLFSVQTGEEGIEYLKGVGRYADRDEYPLPDLVLLDLKLRGMNGFQVLEWIRQQPGLNSSRVVVLTGSTALDDINLAYQLGANSFLVKPMDFESFVQIAGAIAGYWVWISEAPETSREAGGSRQFPSNIDKAS